jgi:glycosyltransferase involved in cell wall biosynthesis
VLLAIDGVIREVVERAEAGLFVTPGDPEALVAGVKELHADRELARRMGLNGRRFVMEEFDRRQWAERLAQVFKRSIAGGKRP